MLSLPESLLFLSLPLGRQSEEGSEQVAKGSGRSLRGEDLLILTMNINAQSFSHPASPLNELVWFGLGLTPDVNAYCFFLALLRGPYGMSGIESGLAECKASSLSAVL